MGKKIEIEDKVEYRSTLYRFQYIFRSPSKTFDIYEMVRALGLDNEIDGKRVRITIEILD